MKLKNCLLKEVIITVKKLETPFTKTLKIMNTVRKNYYRITVKALMTPMDLTREKR
jgi:hypothetical protein